MKKLFFVAAVSFALISCGDGASTVESAKDSLTNAVEQKVDTLQQQVNSAVDSMGAKVDSLKQDVKSVVDSQKK